MSTPLAAYLAEEIRQNGPIPVDIFMSEALYHPDYGYYTTRAPIGAQGDYITAPEMTQVFGECVGVWCYIIWQCHDAPLSCHLVELGPGNGTLMSDCLRTIKTIPLFYEGLTVHMVDCDPHFVRHQQEVLAAHAPKIHWHTSLPHLKEGPVFMIANEFFDALPIKQYHYDGSSWAERCVALQDDALVFTLVPCDPPPLAGIETPGIYETSPAMDQWGKDIAALLRPLSGSFIFIDYGYEGPLPGDTLQSLKNHKYHNPLELIGQADLSHHVDFTALKTVLEKENLVLELLQPLSVSLKLFAFDERTLALCQAATPQQKAALLTAAARLRSSQHMGHLFKVLVGHTL